MTGTYDVQVLAHSAPVVTYDAVIAAVSNSSKPRGGYGCSIFGNTAELVFVSYDGIPVATSTMSSEPVLDKLVLRLTLDGNQLGCRLEHGIAVGALRVAVATTPLTGGPGVSVRKIDARIDAFAAYQQRPGVACPEVVWR